MANNTHEENPPETGVVVGEDDELAQRFSRLEERLAILEQQRSSTTRTTTETRQPAVEPAVVGPPPPPPQPSPTQREPAALSHPVVQPPISSTTRAETQQAEPAVGPPPLPPQPSPTQREPAALSHPVEPPINPEAVLKWAGLTLVVLSAFFLVGTGISRGWIGPKVQLASATLAGLGLIVGAFRLHATNRSWSLALAIGGAVVVPVCAAAANAGLKLLPNGPALAVLAATVVALTCVSVWLDFEAVATLAALAAIALMLWIGEEPELPFVVVDGWVAVVAIGFTGFALVRGWAATRLIVTMSATLTLLAMAVDLVSFSDSERTAALVVLGLVGSTGWMAPAVANTLGNGPRDFLAAVDHRFVAYLPMWSWAILGAVVNFDDKNAWGLAGLALASGYLLIALAAQSLLSRELILSHVLGAAILVPVAFAVFAVFANGPALLVAIAFQAAVTLVIGRSFDDLPLQLMGATMATVSIIWAVGSMVFGLSNELSTGSHLANVLVVVLVIAAAVSAFVSENPNVGRGLAAIGWVAGLLWVAAVVVHGAQGQLVWSGSWALAAAAAITVGVRLADQQVQNVGLTTLAVVLVKLLTNDLAAIDVLWRVGLFFVIGCGLLRLGYLLPRLSPDDIPATEPLLPTTSVESP